jgi:hypothetical protein
MQGRHMGWDHYLDAGREIMGRTTESVESFENYGMDVSMAGFNPTVGLEPVRFQATN